MRTFLKNLPIWKCESRLATIIAIASGAGAAAGCGFLPWYTVLLLLFLPLFLDRRRLAAAVAAAVLCLISGVINSGCQLRKAAGIPSRKCTVSGEVLCLDRRTSGVSFIDNPTVLNVRISLGENDFDAVAIYPEGVRAIYGDRHNFTGTLIPPRPAGLYCENGTVSGEIPPLYGERPLVYMQHISPAGKRFSLLKISFLCRDFLLKKLLSGIRDPETADMASRLFLGASTGASRFNKRNFIISGTIHLFSVSGLHVTLIAGIILLLLRPVPFRWRYRIAAIFTFAYVLCSGASLPAVRAGAMVILWCMMRSYLYPSPAWNSVMYTFAAFALAMPETISTISAQYSFGITAALILLSENTKVIFSGHEQTAAMMPVKSTWTEKSLKQMQRSRKLLMIPAAAAVAFAASAGISLFRQNLFIPGSIITNMLLVFFTPLLFGAMVFKFAAALFFPYLDPAGAFLLEGSFQLLASFTRTMAKIFTQQGTIVPPLWSVILYYLLFFGMLGMKKTLFKKLCLTGTLLILFLWQFPIFTQPQILTVINYGSDHPAAMALSSPGSKTAFVTDIPHPDTGVLMGRLLRRQGITGVQVNFSARNARSAGGLNHLGRELDISIGGASGSRKPGKAFKRNLKEFHLSEKFLPPAIPLSAGKAGKVTCLFPGNILVISEVADNGRKITVHTPGGENISTIIPWCSIPAVWQCEL